jgi:hypothetical protein
MEMRMDRNQSLFGQMKQIQKLSPEVVAELDESQGPSLSVLGVATSRINPEQLRDVLSRESSGHQFSDEEIAAQLSEAAGSVITGDEVFQARIELDIPACGER